MNILFCEDVIKNVLSYLTYQDINYIRNIDKSVNSITNKLVPEVSEKVKICCKKCKNDNLAIQNDICTSCIISLDSLNSLRFITYTDANKLYKFNSKKLDINQFDSFKTKECFISSNKYILFDRLDIEKYVSCQYKNNQDRLEVLYKLSIKSQKSEDVRNKKRLSIKNKLSTDYVEEIKKNEYQNFLKYYSKVLMLDKDKILKSENSYNKFLRQYKKYKSIEIKLKKLNISIRNDSKLLQEYIGDINKLDEEKENIIVLELEEMNYLHTKTIYSKELKKTINTEKQYNDYIDIQEIVITCRSVEFAKVIKNINDEKIPNKWKNIISTYEDIQNMKINDIKKIYISYHEDEYEDVYN